jgi:predicted alpha/beta-hydrolase family hydrolase
MMHETDWCPGRGAASDPRPDGCLWDGPRDAPVRLILAHGAGQGPDAPVLEHVAGGLARAGVAVVRFAFPYMLRSRAEGHRCPPDREPILVDAWHRIIASQRTAGGRLFIGGKSMGGRVASRIADEAGVAGLICLGFPFHPPGRPERTRAADLEELLTPTLICQGECDPFGTREEVERISLSAAVTLYWLAGGDHSFKPRRGSGHSWDAHLDGVVGAAIGFISAIEARSPTRSGEGPLD